MNESLETLLADGIIEAVIGQLKTGKEAEVWLVQHAGQVVAAKLYKERHERNFRNNAGYREGREVRNSRTRRAMEKGSRFGQAAAEEAWKSAESDSLYKLHAQGVRVPTPVMFYEGILLMELVLDAEGHPAPRLVEAPPATPEDAQAMYLDLRSQVVNMLCADLIHGDLSPYNILMGAMGPTIIDFPQTVAAARNSRAEFYFRRDMDNVREFLAGFAPWLRGTGGDTGEIWQAYVRRELTPEFTPSGNFRDATRRQGRGGPRAQRFEGGDRRRDFRAEVVEPVVEAAPKPPMTPEEAAEAELRELEALVLRQGGGERGKPPASPAQRGGRNRGPGGRPPPRFGNNRPNPQGPRPMGGNGPRPPGADARGGNGPQGNGRPNGSEARGGNGHQGNGRPNGNEARGGDGPQGNGRTASGDARGGGGPQGNGRTNGNEARGGHGHQGNGRPNGDARDGNGRPSNANARGGNGPWGNGRPNGDDARGGNGPTNGNEARGGSGPNAPRNGASRPPHTGRRDGGGAHRAGGENRPVNNTLASEANSQPPDSAFQGGAPGRANGRPPRGNEARFDNTGRDGGPPPHANGGGNGHPPRNEWRGDNRAAGNEPRGQGGGNARPPRGEWRGNGGRNAPVVEVRPPGGAPSNAGSPPPARESRPNGQGLRQQRPNGNRGGGGRGPRSGPQVSYVARSSNPSSDSGPTETGS
ncbi:hypothetical protein LY474_01580 [Myxococcus stipitatus]|uniref:RIO1 family regulatory kinase/ATPase domain-containing protein n=1 Tax=Myxococcus stipitatus TaxID=83455 RepID=UPI001F1E556C|nr:RIO1 family regulatory kinase/ATPase [Myxococcus stipitatus]MCE9666490.1 hypothetical protein [Myxococcus stipitatus]